MFQSVSRRRNPQAARNNIEGRGGPSLQTSKECLRVRAYREHGSLSVLGGDDTRRPVVCLPKVLSRSTTEAGIQHILYQTGNHLTLPCVSAKGQMVRRIGS